MSSDPIDTNPIWYYAKDGASYGPVSANDLRNLLASGQLTSADQVWREGLPNWLMMANVPELVPPGTSYGQSQQLLDPFGQAPREGFDFGALLDQVWLHIKRAFSWNVQGVVLTQAEQAQLAGQGIQQEISQRYMGWRRSVFFAVVVVGFIAALWNVITIERDFKQLTAFGTIVVIVQLFTLFALPVAALIAAIIWYRPKSSRQVILGGWLVSFFIPIVIALLPVRWLVKIDGGASGKELDAQLFVAGLILGLLYYLFLMPTVLAIIPGVLRACVRIKSLLPESVVPGWFLVCAAPFYAVFLLVVFVPIFKAASNFALLVSLLSFLVAPLVYVFFAGTFIRPLVTPSDHQKLPQTQIFVAAAMTSGVVFLFVYLMTKEIVGKELMGFSKTDSLFRPWQLVPFLLEYAAKSLFVTTLAADFLLLMNLSIRRNMNALAQSPQGQQYDSKMNDLEQTLDLPVPAEPPMMT